MRDDQLAQILRLADEPASLPSFVDSLWHNLAASWDAVDSIDSDTGVEADEHAVQGGSSTGANRMRYVGPVVAAAVLAGVVAIAGLLLLVVPGERGTDVGSLDVSQACEQFRSNAPGLEDLRVGSEISEDEISKVVEALGVLAIDLESTGEVPFDSIRSLRVAAGGLRQAIARLAEGDPASAQVNIGFALVSLDEADAAPAISSCFVYSGSRTP